MQQGISVTQIMLQFESLPDVFVQKLRSGQNSDLFCIVGGGNKNQPQGVTEFVGLDIRFPKKLEFVVAVADNNWVAAYQTWKKFIWRIVLE